MSNALKWPSFQKFTKMPLVGSNWSPLLQFFSLLHKTYFHVVWHQDLAGFLDHRLRLELLFAEGVPPGVEVLLARGVRQTV